MSDKVISGCHVLVFANNSLFSEDQKFPAGGTLTIGLSKNFLSKGGMIEIGNENKKIIFDVNLTELEAQGLQLGSEVLGLARTVL